MERGSGASSEAIIVAIARFGSFSPPAPVSTVRVTSSAGTSRRRTFHDELNARPGRNADVRVPVDIISGRSVADSAAHHPKRQFPAVGAHD